MHDELFANQAKWSTKELSTKQAIEYFEGLAEELELNVDQFKSDFKSQSVLDAIRSDEAEIRKKLLPNNERTPSLFIKKGDRGDELVDVYEIVNQGDKWFDDILGEFRPETDSD